LFKKSYNLEKDFEKRCALFIELILKYNKTHNITGAKDSTTIIENIEDSIYPITFLSLEKIKTAIDVGSGAGFPGLLLAMAMPKTHFTLFEPIKKKSAFLHLAKSTLGLKNVTVCSQRVEEHEAFEADLICSRAVTNTNMLITLCKKYISSATQLLFYKGENVANEIEDITNFKIYKRDKRNYLLIKEIKHD
jgi:16S rRNA (guanine527-N7)-methyltransferase